MKRRYFLRLSTAGAVAALWGCEDGGRRMQVSHGQPGPTLRGRVPGQEGEGAAFASQVEPGAPGAAASRSVYVQDPDAAHTAFDAQGYGYEIEPHAGRVVERGMLGVLIRQFGAYGVGPSQLNNPVALVFGPDDHMYVVDRGNSRVQVFDRDARHLRQIGRHGSGPQELSYPRALAFDTDGRLLVADTLNHRVQIFDLEGRSLGRFGELGRNPGELNAPVGLAIGPDALLHVLEAGNRRVQVFTLDGAPQYTYGTDRFALPRALVVAGDGTSFVADVANAAVEVFGRDGTFEQRLSPTFDGGAPAAPVQLALDADGDLYVTAIAAAA
jgi:hypothetical protein